MGRQTCDGKARAVTRILTAPSKYVSHPDGCRAGNTASRSRPATESDARLLGCDTTRVGRDRFAAVRGIAARYRACVVLKGSGSLIADPQGALAVCAQLRGKGHGLVCCS